ncbi:hypothetical protein Sjap_026358 [Stephania japonica]|uniref:Uncharacterized protein n=1 Tax=Stephania japonica TaxID=461633 RepID=A0AAP0HIF2_9MAGN
MEEIQAQGNCRSNKLLRIGVSKIGQKGGEAYQDEDEEDGEEKTNVGGGGGGGGGGGDEGGRSLRAWYSSRIHRVSRSAGGKDRHSKVLTAKGLRDRRVRLSVSTAIQFYDLQDRLGYDQPSKAVEWLIKAAADAISELPSLESKFPGTPKQLMSDEKRSSPSAAEMELDIDEHNSFHHHHHQQQQQQQQMSLSKSACSSTSETSKGSSALSLSRSQSRVKARERARERTAKVDVTLDQKQQLKDITPPQNHHNSFTELLTGSNSSPNHHHFVLRTASMDYFNSMSMGLYNTGQSSRPHFSAGSAGLIPSQTLFGIAPPPHMPQQQQQQQQQQQFSHHHPEMQHFSFVPDQLISDGADYNLNFSISSSGGLAGYSNNNRGTLQSNSTPFPMSSHHHHLHQRFSSAADGPNMTTSFSFMGASAAPTSSADQNQFPPGGLQLCYGGDNDRQSDLKGKGKN